MIRNLGTGQAFAFFLPFASHNLSNSHAQWFNTDFFKILLCFETEKQ